MITINQMANTGNAWAVITFDETQNWCEDIGARAETIEGVYLVNLKEPTNLCEITVSYPATFLKNFFHKTSKFDEDELTNLERENGGDDLSYYSGSSTPKLVKYYQEGTEEEILETELSNPSYC